MQDSKDVELNKKIDQRIAQKVPEYLKAGAFTDRKLTDTPTDNLQVVNRKFVTANGLTATRPTNPTTGQFYFDTDLGYPIWWFNGNWVDAQGNTA